MAGTCGRRLPESVRQVDVTYYNLYLNINYWENRNVYDLPIIDNKLYNKYDTNTHFYGITIIYIYIIKK